MEAVLESHSAMALLQWDSLNQKINARAKSIVINGHNLDLATVVAVARLVNLADCFVVLELIAASDTELRQALIKGRCSRLGRVK